MFQAEQFKGDWASLQSLIRNFDLNQYFRISPNNIDINGNIDQFSLAPINHSFGNDDYIWVDNDDYLVKPKDVDRFLVYDKEDFKKTFSK